MLAKIRAWRKGVKPRARSSFARAVSYMDDLWTRLVVFTTNPLVPLDNNLLERAMRGPVVGRKNHYGSQSLCGTRAAAVMYSLVETCKLLDVSVERYLMTLATRALASDTPVVLLPHEFNAEVAAQA